MIELAGDERNAFARPRPLPSQRSRGAPTAEFKAPAGRYSTVTAYVARVPPRPAPEPVVRFETWLYLVPRFGGTHRPHPTDEIPVAPLVMVG